MKNEINKMDNSVIQKEVLDKMITVFLLYLCYQFREEINSQEEKKNERIN